MDDTGVVLIVFWVVAVNPLVGYAIGERKGNVATGIILGLLLGPIGWLVTAMCFSNLRKCPFCSEDIKPDAKVCRYCGRDLPPPSDCEIAPLFAAGEREFGQAGRLITSVSAPMLPAFKPLPKVHDCTLLPPRKGRAPDLVGCVAEIVIGQTALRSR